MTHIIAETTLASAVAQNGNFTVNYPDGYNAGNFAGYGHKMTAVGLQTDFTQDAGQISLAFGASSITVTYKGATSIPANSRVTLELNQAGGFELPATIQGIERAVAVPLTRIDIGAADVADPNGVAESQSVSSAFTLDGALVDANGHAVFDVPRNVVAAWTTAAVLTITGEDEYGNTMVEQSASGTSHTGKKAFKKVTGVTASTAITSATVGSGDVLGLPFFVDSMARIVAEMEDGAIKNGRGGNVILTGRVALTNGTYGVVQSPINGTIKSIRTVEVEGGVTTNDAVCTFKIATTAITNGVITIATSGSAAGVVDSASPTAANVVAAGDAINVTVSGTPGGTKTAIVAIEIEPDQDQNGVFVAGVQTTPTATTGDVRGTYAPATTPDGSAYFSLLVDCPDPTYKGVTHYAG